ncbi:MAG: cell division protein FtsH, partial [Rhodospirillales bacterium]
MTDDEKRLTAYHEAGHALVGLRTPGNDPLHKVTIIPRGRALGVTMNLPDRDRYAFSKRELQARLAMMFGGRIAEELVFGPENVTTGAGNDIQQATNLARRMVTEWGMSDALGRLRYSDNEDQIFLGRAITHTQNVSDETARLIDTEVRLLIEQAEATAHGVLGEDLDGLHAIAEALLAFETLTGDEVRTILAGGSVVRDDHPGEDRPPSKTSVPPVGDGIVPRRRPVVGGPQVQPQG